MTLHGEYSNDPATPRARGSGSDANDGAHEYGDDYDDFAAMGLDIPHPYVDEDRTRLDDVLGDAKRLIDDIESMKAADRRGAPVARAETSSRRAWASTRAAAPRNRRLAAARPGLARGIACVRST